MILPKSIDKISNLSYNIHMQKKRQLSASREPNMQLPLRRPMTLPDERYRAVTQTQRFLLRILTTPRVPKAVKDEARSMLRHYPSDWDMQRAAAAAPEVFQERMEDLHRFVLKGQQQDDSDIVELMRGYKDT
jgi:hypothetical protein